MSELEKLEKMYSKLLSQQNGAYSKVAAALADVIYKLQGERTSERQRKIDEVLKSIMN